MKEYTVSAKRYLNEAESEQLELMPWFDLVTGAESSLGENDQNKTWRDKCVKVKSESK